MTNWRDINASTEPAFKLKPKVTREQKLEASQLEALQLARQFHLTFTSPQGRKVLDQLRARFSDRSSIVPNDPYATHANEGAREMYLYIEDMINAGEKDDEPKFLE